MLTKPQSECMLWQSCVENVVQLNSYVSTQLLLSPEKKIKKINSLPGNPSKWLSPRAHSSTEKTFFKNTSLFIGPFPLRCVFKITYGPVGFLEVKVAAFENVLTSLMTHISFLLCSALLHLSCKAAFIASLETYGQITLHNNLYYTKGIRCEVIAKKQIHY